MVKNNIENMMEIWHLCLCYFEEGHSHLIAPHRSDVSVAFLSLFSDASVDV